MAIPEEIRDGRTDLVFGESPLSWASWYARPASILRKLCYRSFHIHPDYGAGMEANLLGKPHSKKKA